MTKQVIPAKFRSFCCPPILADGEHFLIKIADTEEEIKQAQKLRYEIFNAEQGRLNNLKNRDFDTDIFDPFCLHLIVIEKVNARIVGTYRVHPGCVASEGIGFYSATEYNIENLHNYADMVMEYGRSCVDSEYRNGAVVSLLWSGIGALHKRSKMRYLLGCVSLESTDPVVGWAVYCYAQTLVRTPGAAPICGTPLPEYVLPHPGKTVVDEFIKNSPEELALHMPPLLKGYLRLGAYLAGEPVLDREFGSIDILIWVDLDNISARYRRHFIGE